MALLNGGFVPASFWEILNIIATIRHQDSDDEIADAKFLTSQNPLVETLTSIMETRSWVLENKNMDLPLLNQLI
jgi:hypothetical protein